MIAQKVWKSQVSRENTSKPLCLPKKFAKMLVP
jgi:hypothetical protein